MKTTVINLFGGPGSGKSTTAAALFAAMKRDGKNVELVREYVKEWAWAGRVPNAFDQPHIFGEQSQRESQLYGKVRYVITDSPLWLSAVYDREGYQMRPMIRRFTEIAAMQDVRHINYVLKRTKAYDPNGRFQDEAGAKAIDDKIVDVLRSSAVPHTAVNVDDTNKVAFILSDLEFIKEYA